MSRYPDNTPGPRPAEVAFRCEACDTAWFASATYDLGFCALDDEGDAACVSCGRDGCEV